MRSVRILFASALVLVLAASAHADDFGSAQKDIDQKLSAALGELNRVRDKIAAEKVPLSRAVSGLENDVLALRQRKAALLQERDNRGIDLTTLRKQVEALASQEDFANARLNEFVRDFEARLDISENAVYLDVTEAAKLADKNANLDAQGKRQTQVRVVDAALGRLGEQLGGQIFAGEALSPAGVLTKGKFVTFGPTVFYASDDGQVAGLVENQLNAADPVVVALPEHLNASIVALATTGQGMLPLDATLGKALRVEKARKSIWAYIQDGGVVGYVIVALGLAALLLTAFKVSEIMGFRVAAGNEVDGVLDALRDEDFEGAVRRATSVQGVSGEILVSGIEHSHEKRGVLEEHLFEKILRARPGLERFLPFLSITAAAAPLLGLLGTVIGMIKTFQLITIFGTGDAKSLSSGISEALVTTALGLIVAIPTLIMHGGLSRMAKHKLGQLEALSVAFVNGITAMRSETGRKKPLAPAGVSAPYRGGNGRDAQPEA